MYIASNDTAITPVAASQKTIGSVGSTPKRRLSRNRVTPTAAATPITTPIAARVSKSRLGREDSNLDFRVQNPASCR